MPYMETDLPRSRFSRRRRTFRHPRSYLFLGVILSVAIVVGYINRELIQKGDVVEVWAGLDLSSPVERPFVVTQAGSYHALTLRPSKQARLEAVVRSPDGDLVVHHRDQHIHNRGTRLWRFLPMEPGEYVVTFSSFHTGEGPAVDVSLYENDAREETNFFPSPDDQRRRSRW